MKFNQYRELAHNEIIEAVGYDIVIQRYNMGTLSLRSGQLVACDLVEHPDAEPFVRSVPPGAYTVRGIVAHMRDDPEIAYLSLEVGPNEATSWKMAQVPSEVDSEALGARGFMVHSGVGALMDAQTALLWMQHRVIHAGPEPTELEKTMKATLRKSRKRLGSDQSGWAMLQNRALEDESLLVFSVGKDPDLITTYFGWDEHDNLTRVVLDLGVLDLRFMAPRRRDPRRFVAT